MHWSIIDQQTLRLFCLMRTFLDFLCQLPLAIRFHLIVVMLMLDIRFLFMVVMVMLVIVMARSVAMLMMVVFV